MQVPPSTEELIGVVAQFLREEVATKTEGALAFHARVAANVLDIVLREGTLAATAAAREQARLATITGSEGSTEALNTRLCLAIRNGDLDLGDPALAEHLWATTLDRMAIDQPKYAAYRHELARDTPSAQEDDHGF